MTRRRFAKPKKSRLGLWCSLAIAVLLGGYVLALVATRPHVTGDRLRIDTFVDYARRGVIKDAHLLEQDSYVVGTYERPGSPLTIASYNLPYLNAANSRERLLDVLLEGRVPTDVRQQTRKRLLVVGDH